MKQNKKIEIKFSLQERYDLLAQDKERLDAELSKISNSIIPDSLKTELQVFAKRYWSLQYEQFDYWRDGFVDWDTYKFWIDCKRRSYNKVKEADTFQNIDSYVHKYGWGKSKSTWNDSILGNTTADFVLFRFKLLEQNENIDAVMAEFGPKPRHRNWIL